MSAPAEHEDRADQARMTFWEHLEELRKRLKVVLVVLVVLFVLFMTFTATWITVGSVQIPMLVPAFAVNSTPVSSQFFDLLVAYLKPSYVQLSAKAPWDGAVAQVKTAFFLAIMVSSPLIAYEFGAFIGPALKPSERRLIMRMMLPVILLFFAGVALDFFLLLPFTINLLYSIQRGMGVTLYVLFLDDFITFVTVHLVAFGIAFQLPVLMYSLAAVGIVKSDFWKKYWRYVTVGVFVIAAVITPDPSGVTMIIVGGIMMGLYGIGYVFARRVEKRKALAQGS